MEFSIFNISLFLGMAGLLAFIISFLTGLRFIKIKAKYKLHKRIGIAGFIAVCIHGCVMSYYYFFT
ncbi:MAG: hypothetical protein ACD_77C00143G0016 [uncultured bacterium]|nr:MAG: hypothetical protein ACD_77C00143G0016 [uncultured bacterium]HBY01415.1 hypothetical protein [Rikenellaceae bacterium]